MGSLDTCHAQQRSCLCIAIEVLIDSSVIQRATLMRRSPCATRKRCIAWSLAWPAEKAGKVRKNPSGPPCCTRGTTRVAPASQHAFTCGRTHRARLCAPCIVSLHNREENDADTLSPARGRGSDGEMARANRLQCRAAIGLISRRDRYVKYCLYCDHVGSISGSRMASAITFHRLCLGKTQRASDI
jgi:hypothetical protein